MSETSPSSIPVPPATAAGAPSEFLYRYACPHCQKVLKIRLEWAGKRGTCPQCHQVVEFPAFRPPSAASATTQQLLKVVATQDDPLLDDTQADRMSLLLSQGTCTDYALADRLLAGRALSPRQWRRVLNGADQREGFRLRVESRSQGAQADSPESHEPLALLAAGDIAAPNAWKVLARFLYYQRHGTCEACKGNPTGMACIYRTFAGFLDDRTIPETRAENWRLLLHRHLGL